MIGIALKHYIRVLRLLLNGSLCGSETCDGHTEGRARCIVHANLGAELHRAGLTTMLTTDTAAELRTYSTAFLHGILDKLTYTHLVEYLERVNLQNLLVVAN